MGDIDLQIQYNDPRFPDQCSRDSVRAYGSPYKSTLHGANSKCEPFVCSSWWAPFFKVIKLLIDPWPGTQTKVFGVNTGLSSTSWECFINNISFSINPPDSSDSNNRIICEDGLVDGPHNPIIDATGLDDQTFGLMIFNMFRPLTYYLIRQPSSSII